MADTLKDMDFSVSNKSDSDVSLNIDDRIKQTPQPFLGGDDLMSESSSMSDLLESFDALTERSKSNKKWDFRKGRMFF